MASTRNNFPKDPRGQGAVIREDEEVKFQCNVCGALCETTMKALDREVNSCPQCGSTVRFRSIIHVLSTELFGKSIPLSDFPKRPDIKGVGLSDWEGYAVPLSQKVSYINTYYHQEPRLDITSVDASMEDKFDFIISSDVFEHVFPPVSNAFNGSRRLLNKSGFIILTVPYGIDPSAVTKEHYPDLYRYEVIPGASGKAIRNMTRDGKVQIFENPVFHGGDGETLEVRVFSQRSIMDEFRNAGFEDVKIYDESFMKYGIYWRYPWSLPIVARVAKNDSPVRGGEEDCMAKLLGYIRNGYHNLLK